MGLACQRRVSQLPFRDVVGRFDLWVENKYEQLFRDHQSQQFVDEVSEIRLGCGLRFAKPWGDVGPLRQ